MLWGDFAWQLKERSATPVVQIMLRKFEASDFLTGLFLLSLPNVIGLVLGTYISYRSDRHRGRWGRRIPYLLVTSPVATLAMYGLAFSPVIGAWVNSHLGLGPGRLNFTIILVMGLSWTVFEFATVTANAVFGGLINDVVPRELIGRFFGMFRAVSLLSGMLFNYFLIGHAAEFFRPILVGIGTLYGAGVMVMCLMVKEGDYPPPEEGTAGGLGNFVAALRSYWRDCFSRPYYWWVFCAMALGGLASAPVNLFSVYAAQTFGMPMGTYGKYLMVTYACSFVLAYPLGWLADRFHPVRMAIAAMTTYGLVMAVGFFTTAGPQSFGLLLLLHGVIGGCYFTGAAAMGQMLFPKLKFAQFAAAVALITALASIVLGPVLGDLLDHLGHDYRYTFALGSVFGWLAVFTTLVVWRRFVALGGPRGYVAPE